MERFLVFGLEYLKKVIIFCVSRMVIVGIREGCEVKESLKNEVVVLELGVFFF